MFYAVVFLYIFGLAYSHDLVSNVDISTLSELSLDKLLQVQKTFLVDQGHFQDKLDPLILKPDVPEALPLQGKRKPNDREGYHSYGYEEDYKKSDKKDIQSIFQISVTTLAFLAFGGYLLCLLCQAISNKNDMSNATNTQVVQAIIKQASIRRGTKRPTRKNRYKKRRPINYRKKLRPRPKREIWIENVSSNEESEKMYWALISLSEGYAGYHTVNYNKINQTTHYNYI